MDIANAVDLTSLAQQQCLLERLEAKVTGEGVVVKGGKQLTIDG